MSVPEHDERTSQPAGLCTTCRHSRRIETAHGSVFRLCERSRTDPHYPRYPVLPVLRCPGYERADDRALT